MGIALTSSDEAYLSELDGRLNSIEKSIVYSASTGMNILDIPEDQLKKDAEQFFKQ